MDRLSDTPADSARVNLVDSSLGRLVDTLMAHSLDGPEEKPPDRHTDDEG